MYQKPALQLYGDLRALTLLGTGADGDLSGTFLQGSIADGCNIIPAGTCNRS